MILAHSIKSRRNAERLYVWTALPKTHNFGAFQAPNLGRTTSNPGIRVVQGYKRDLRFCPRGATMTPLLAFSERQVLYDL